MQTERLFVSAMLLVGITLLMAVLLMMKHGEEEADWVKSRERGKEGASAGAIPKPLEEGVEEMVTPPFMEAIAPIKGGAGTGDGDSGILITGRVVSGTGCPIYKANVFFGSSALVSSLFRDKILYSQDSIPVTIISSRESSMYIEIVSFSRKSMDRFLRCAQRHTMGCTTGLDGRFRCTGRTNEKEGKISVFHPEYLFYLSDPVNTNQKSIDLGDIVLTRWGALEGTVYDQEGKPVAKVKVNARSTGGTSHEYTTLTNEEGMYLLEGMMPAEYRVNLSYELKLNTDTGFPFAATVNDPDTCIVWVKGGCTTPCDLHFSPKASLSGQIIEGSAPVGGMMVWILQDNSICNLVVDSGVTDQNGGYSFRDLLAGNYMLQLILKGHGRSMRTAVTLDKGAALWHEIVLPTGRVSGRITDLSTGIPLADVKVSLAREGRRDESEEDSICMYSLEISVAGVTFSTEGIEPVRTDDEGNYEILFVADGVYIITAEKEGYEKGSLSSILVIDDNETLNTDFQLKRKD